MELKNILLGAEEGVLMQLLDSRLLIKMLKTISPEEITSETLHYLLMSGDNVVKCLTYGNNNTQNAYWPRPQKWQSNANEIFNGYKKIYTEVEEAENIGLRKLVYCLSYSKPPQSLAECFIRLLDEIFIAYYNEDIDFAKSEIIRILTELDAPEEDIRHIKEIDTLPHLSQFLANRAQNKGVSKSRVTKNAKKAGISVKTNTRADTNSDVSERIRIMPYTYSELCKKGLTARKISEQLISNDAALYGSDILGANAGTAEQWAAQIEAAQDNWFFFCEGTKIVGNWSITFLSPDEEKSVRQGIFAGDDFSLASVNYPLMASDKEVVIYILNISLNEGYASHENWEALWRSFGNRMRKLIQSGITIKRIYSDLFRDDHKAIFEKMGFKHLVKNVVSGDIYCLDLSKPDISNFSWIMPDAGNVERSITFRQLSQSDILTRQQLMDISGLVFDTDKYIYPPLFSTREQAKKILPMLFESGEDSMFNLDNIFCAMIGKRIVGLILHKRGHLKWSADKLLEYASMLDIALPETVKTVEQDYFKGYEATAADTTAILNCCVNSNYRMRNEIRLGTRMMQAFIEQHPERLELYVLQETKAAMRLYLRTGFKLSEKCNGFSIDKRELPCFFMYRPAKQET